MTLTLSSGLLQLQRARRDSLSTSGDAGLFLQEAHLWSRRMPYTTFKAVCALATCCIGSILLAGCDGSSGQRTEVSRVGETRFQTPVVLREVAKLDPDALILEVLVNEQSTVLTRGENDVWSGVVEVPANESSSVVVRWGQNYG